jgi:membrane protein required for beta-lactamase induction
MVKWLQKILFVVISLSFFISVIEMDLGEVHNTFFDEYDTYLKAEQVSIDQATTLQQEHDTYVFLYNLISHYTSLNGHPENSKHQCNAYYTHYPPKLFLRNSVWRI